VTPLLAAGLLLLPAQTGVPPTGPQDKVIDVRASRAPAGNTFEALWAAYEKAVAKNDQETARNVLREIRRLRIERNILALDTFALAHVDQGLDLLRKGDLSARKASSRRRPRWTPTFRTPPSGCRSWSWRRSRWGSCRR